MQELEEQVLDRQACVLLYVRAAAAEEVSQAPSCMMDKTRVLSMAQGDLCMTPPSTGKRCGSWLKLQSFQWLHTRPTQLFKHLLLLAIMPVPAC